LARSSSSEARPVLICSAAFIASARAVAARTLVDFANACTSFFASSSSPRWSVRRWISESNSPISGCRCAIWARSSDASLSWASAWRLCWLACSISWAYAGMRGGPRGDLYIFISVRPHELFERDGLDLLCTVPVPMCVAALGGEMEAPCLLGGENCDGECKITVKVPEGAQTGRTIRVKGRGMPSLRSRERGDLVVELFVETPSKLTPRQKELMRELAGLCSEQQHPKSANFLGKAKRFWDEVTGAA
jgi:hypothetical protein